MAKRGFTINAIGAPADFDQAIEESDNKLIGEKYFEHWYIRNSAIHECGGFCYRGRNLAMEGLNLGAHSRNNYR